MNDHLNVIVTSARNVANPAEASWVVRELLRLRTSADAAGEPDGNSAANGEVRQ